MIRPMEGGSPRFRRDLQAATVEADGVLYVEVTDPQRGQSFRFYDFEHTVATAMDGRPLLDVARELRDRAELDLSQEQLAAFAEQLQALGFLDEVAAPAAAPPERAVAAPAPLSPPAADLPEIEAIELPAELSAGLPAESPATSEGDSEGIPAFFPPLAADESGHFSGAAIGRAAMAMNNASAGANPEAPATMGTPKTSATPASPESLDLLDAPLPASPTAKAEDPAAALITPPPVLVTPAKVTPSDRPVAPGIDRTLTSFPPEVLPADAGSRGGKTSPAKRPPESTPPPITAREQTPAPVSGRERTRVPLSELGARERTPPPVPLDARVSVPVQKPARPETDDALTTEMDVVSFMGDGTPAPHTDDDPMGGEITSAGMDLSQFHADEIEAEVARAFAASPAPASMAEAPAPALQGFGTTGPVTVPTPKPVTASDSAPAPSTSASTSGSGSTSSPNASPSSPTSSPSPIFGTDAPIPVHVSEPSTPVAADFAHVVGGAEGAAAANAPVEPAAETPSGKLDADPRERPTQELQAVQLSVRFADPPSGDSPPDDQALAAETANADGSGDGESRKPARLITPFATSDTPGGDNEEAPQARTPWKTYAIYAALAIAAAAVITVMGLRLLESPEPNRVTVDTMTPEPRTVYRYWDASAKAELGTADALSFTDGGKVAELAAVGTKFVPGDVLGLLDSGRKFRADYNHNNDRLTHYQGLLEKTTAAGNRPEMRQAELKIAEKKRLMAEAQANMAKHAIIATESGEVAEAAVKVGDNVKAGAPILRGKGAGFRAVFELPREQAESARQLGFCKAEIDGKQLDCSLAADGGDETHVPIDLPNDPSVTEGKTVRLARDKLEAVYTVPTSALHRVGDTDRIFVVVGKERSSMGAEMRVVVVADRGTNEAIVTQGIEAGDRVILNPTRDLESSPQVLIRNEQR
jgi:hypothetical protein